MPSTSSRATISGRDRVDEGCGAAAACSSCSCTPRVGDISRASESVVSSTAAAACCGVAAAPPLPGVGAGVPVPALVKACGVAPGWRASDAGGALTPPRKGAGVPPDSSIGDARDGDDGEGHSSISTTSAGASEGAVPDSAFTAKVLASILTAALPPRRRPTTHCPAWAAAASARF